MDSEAVLRHLLTRTPSEFFHSPMLAFELTCFCRDNLPLFGRNLDILKRSFPNLFKARVVVLGQSRGPGGGCIGRRVNRGAAWGSVRHMETAPTPGGRALC